LTELAYLESTFFNVLADLKEYLNDLTLVGGWLSYVYSKFLWGNLTVTPVTTSDIDFGLGAAKTKIYKRTIFDLLSSLDYKERHPQMDRMFPVVFYKEGKVRLDFIAPLTIEGVVLEKVLGTQIDINKIEKFDFLLKHRIPIEVRDAHSKAAYKINCPKPSAFLYHKGASFVDREDEQKKAKDLHYMYFILRYAPDKEVILEEAAQYKKQGYLKEVAHNIDEYFAGKTSRGCLMVEKENGPDAYLDDLRQDIFERFSQLRSSL